jgi:outer membrane receptor protein involved in Fe transport
MSRSRKRKLRRTSAKLAGLPFASAVIAGAPVAHAQQADQGFLQEIVVTAQKRAEDLQKVPISIQVLGGEQLEQFQVQNFDDYAKLLPSVSFLSLGPSQSEIFFRGVSTGGNNLHAGALPTSGLYLDEIPVTTIGGSLDLHVYDIARVEALSGPQGTLYGASSLSGTLRIITNKPDPKAFAAGYDLKGTTVSKGDPGGSLEGFVNLPISDTVAVRLVGFYDYDGGYIDYVPKSVTYQRIDGQFVAHPATFDNGRIVGDNANGTKTYGGRAALKVDLNDSWSITPAVIYQHQDANGQFLFDPKAGDLKSPDFFKGRQKDQWYQSALTVEGKISNFDLVYSGGWFERRVDNLVDYSQYTVAYDRYVENLVAANDPYAAYYAGYASGFTDANGNFIDPTQYTRNRDKYTKMSHEIRISTPQDRRLRGVFGAFYQRQTDDIRVNFAINGLGPFWQVHNTPDTLYLSAQTRVDRDTALFTEWHYDLSDKLSLTGGIRKYWVRNTLYGFFGYNNDGYSSAGEAACFLPTPVGPGQPSYFPSGDVPCVNTDKKVVENGTTQKVNVQYQFDRDRMVYATYSTGFRPGGNNRRVQAKTWRADRLINLELGWKTAWFDRRLRWNGAVFVEKWKDAQTTIQGQNGITSIVNAGDAKITGWEGDVAWAATDRLTFGLSFTNLWKAATTTDFCKPTPLGAAVTNCAPEDLDAAAGTKLPVTAKLKGTMSARYTFDVAGLASFAQLGFAYQGSTTYSLEEPKNQIIGQTPAFGTFDLSAGTGQGNWTAELFVINLADKRGELARSSECADVLNYCLQNYRVYPTKPRTFGIKFGQKF